MSSKLLGCDGRSPTIVKSWKSSLHTYALAFSPDGQRLAHGGNYRYIEILDVSSGETLASRRNLDGEVRSLAFHSDGEHLIVGDTSGKVYFWDSKTAELDQFFRGHTSAAIVATPRPGMREVVSLEDHGAIKFWNIDTIQGQMQLPGAGFYLADVQFSPQGDWLATAEGIYWNHDRQLAVQLWNTKTGELGPRLIGHEKNVFGVAFRGDGKQLASAGDDGKVILLDLTTAEPIGNTWVTVPHFSRWLTATMDNNWRPARPTDRCSCGTRNRAIDRTY